MDHNKLWKILKEMGIPECLTCLLRNLYADQKATVRTGHGTTDWFQIGKGVCQGCILSSCLFNLYAEYIMRNAGLEEAQAGIKISRRNINNLRYAVPGSCQHSLFFFFFFFAWDHIALSLLLSFLLSLPLFLSLHRVFFFFCFYS